MSSKINEQSRSIKVIHVLIISVYKKFEDSQFPNKKGQKRTQQRLPQCFDVLIRTLKNTKKKTNRRQNQTFLHLVPRL